MKAPRYSILGIGLVVAALALPSTAQARFGQRDDHAKTSSSGHHGHGERRESHVEEEDHDGGLFGIFLHALFAPRHHHHDSYVYVEPAPVYVAPPPAYYAPPPPPSYPPPPDGSVSAPAAAPVGAFGLGITAQAHGEGATLGLGLYIEGQRFGFNLNGDGIYARGERDPLTIDTIRLADAHLTYAFVANRVLRLRLEAGASGAIGDDLAALGPDFGVSGRLRIVGPLGIEAASHVTPTPFVRVDSKGALVLNIGVVQLQGGWRHTYLDDRGLVGARNVDRFTGPFGGIALVF